MRIPIAGKISTMVFDKTGTITKALGVVRGPGLGDPLRNVTPGPVSLVVILPSFLICLWRAQLGGQRRYPYSVTSVTCTIIVGIQLCWATLEVNIPTFAY